MGRTVEVMEMKKLRWTILLWILQTVFLFDSAIETHALGSDATLKSLDLSCGKVSPGFSSGRNSYSLHVAQSVASVTVTAVLNAPDASLTVDGIPAKSGEASPPVALELGRNLIPIEVTAQDGTTKNVYSLKIIRSYPTPHWIRVKENSPWPARDSAGELVFKDRMWLYGGYTPAVINDVWSSRDGITWEKAGSIPNESGINIPVNFVHEDKMWVACNDGQLYSSEDGLRWDLVTDKAPWKGRYAAGGVVFAGKMWVMGGFKNGDLYNDVWSSTDGVEWAKEVEEAPWSKRQIFGMLAAVGGKMWLMGGGITLYHPFRAYNDVWSSPDGRTWTQITDNAPWPCRIWSTSVVYKNRLWTLGGFRSEPDWNNFNDVWYSANGADWSELVTETVWSPRHEISAYVFAGRIWVVAGNEWPLKNDVWSLEIPGLVFLTQPVVEEFVYAQYTYRAHADFNESTGEVKYRLVDSPEWLHVDPDTGVVWGTPTILGEFEVTVEAYDTTGETARQSYTLHVIPTR
jgi:hypothetical protein